MQNSFFDNGMIGEEEKYIVYCYLIQNLARKNLMKVTSITQVFYLIGKSSEQQSSKICKILQQSQFFCVRGAKIDCLRFEVIKLLDHISDRIKPRNCALSEFLLQFFFQFLYIMCKKYFILYKGPDNLQLTLLNWDTESVLALNKKLKFPIHFQFFQCQNTFSIPIGGAKSFL